MAGVVVTDTIRGVEIEVALPEGATVAEWTSYLVGELGLPDQTLPERGTGARAGKGRLISYQLLLDGGDLPLESGRRLSLDDLGPAPRLRIESTEGSAVWNEIVGLVDDIENELELQTTTFAETVRSDINDEVTARLTAVRLEAEAEAKKRLRGIFDSKPFGRSLRAQVSAWRSRRTADAMLRRIGGTGAVPDAVADARLGITQVATLATRAVRVAGVGAVVAGTAVGTTAIGQVYDDDLTKADVVAAVEAELEKLDLPTTTTTVEDGSTTSTPAVEPPGLDLTVLLADPANVEAVNGVLDPKFALVVDAIETIDEPPERDPLARATLGGFDEESPKRSVTAGASLWAIASAARANPPAECGPVAELSETTPEYVSRIWAANVGSVGADPDAIDPDTVLVVPCPR